MKKRGQGEREVFEGKRSRGNVSEPGRCGKAVPLRRSSKEKTRAAGGEKKKIASLSKSR
jgi:hypothetical protein